MPKTDLSTLGRLLEEALAGEPGPLRCYLCEQSGLPGPRGNLELAGQLADLVASLAGGEQAPAAWEVAVGLAAVGPAEAPTGDPGEFLAFCGTLGLAGFAGQGHRRREVWQALQTAATDPRWRLREAAAQAIQRALTVDRRGTLGVLGEWAAEGGWLLLRAVAAGVADPPLLADPGLAVAARHLHEVVLARFVTVPDRRDPGFRVLRRGLGYSLSVVVAAAPEPGFALLRELAAVPDLDLRRVLSSNLAKSRLARSYPEEVEEVRRLLAG